MQAQRTLNFNDIGSAIGQKRIFSGPSYAHGWLCGMICAGNKMNGSSWAELLLGIDDHSNLKALESRQLLLDLHRASCEQLHNFSFEFQVLLPDDESDLMTRATSLSEWCEGFLESLALAGIGLGTGQLKECQDVLRDFTEIAALDYDQIKASKSDQESFEQVVEYVRMAVLLIYTVMTTKQNRSRRFSPESITEDYLH